MEVLLRIWVGHSTHGIKDNYTVESLKAAAEFRRLAAEEAGLGFHIHKVEDLLIGSKRTQIEEISKLGSTLIP